MYAEMVVKSICDYIGVPYKQEVQSGEYYIVQKGDTLWGIANKYGTTVDKLKEINNLSSNILSIGQKLLVSKVDVSDDYYIVQKGDTLWSIAKKYNVSVDQLKEVNNLYNSLINIGQKLIIPKNDKTYTVQKGDTLWSIAKANNISVDELKNKNNLTSNVIFVGQKLKI